MLSFKQYLKEKVDPIKLLSRFSTRYAQSIPDQEDFGEMPVMMQKIPLKNYDEDESMDMDDKLYRYKKSGLSGKNKTFKINDLTPSQQYVRVDDTHRLEKKINKQKESPIQIATHNGKNFVVDGHHRILAARLRGEKEVKVKHYDLDSWDK